ncbi:hypothetical protein BaRGS_00013462 [Batillaria attramentaria]|uniref:Uncharacterized protein n=1 Tax=Batillaria attramentaria TaxID=370345 RepID=A0ABD0L7Y9_9CAEN
MTLQTGQFVAMSAEVHNVDQVSPSSSIKDNAHTQTLQAHRSYTLVCIEETKFKHRSEKNSSRELQLQLAATLISLYMLKTIPHKDKKTVRATRSRLLSRGANKPLAK